MTRWARALADDIDPVIVDRLVAGQPVASYTSYERREAVRRLHAAGLLSKADVAARLRVASRQVYRDLDALGIPTSYRQADVYAVACGRHPVVVRLAAAGCRRGEIAALLHCSIDAVGRAFGTTGCTPADTRGLPRRPLDELRRLYGHLLVDDVQAGAA